MRRPSQIVKNVGSFTDFFEDVQGAVVLVDPDPNIMELASRLRDLPYQKTGSKNRLLSTTDAIMLATCVQLHEMFDVNVQQFHTYDDGKKRGLDGKAVPLLSFQQWCESFSGEHLELAKKVIRIDRKKPIYPAPTMPGI